MVSMRRLYKLGDRVLIHPAITTEKLHASIYAVYLAFGDPEFCHRRSCRILLPFDQQFCAVVYEGLANGDLRFNVSQ